MAEPFVGSEALASGCLTPYTLRSRFVAVHRDVYVSRDTRLTAAARANAAWLWSGRSGVVAGQSAAAWHGAKWVDDDAAAEILYANRRPPNGIHSWSDGYASDEVQTVRGIVVTTPARTALDIACRYPLGRAVASMDALARATRLTVTDVERLAQRHRGRRGIRNARDALALVDPGAESPQETRVRLVLIGAGFPRPETQIPVYDEWGQIVAVIDMVGAASRWASTVRIQGLRGTASSAESSVLHGCQFDRDVRRFEAIAESGWQDVRVTAEDTDGSIVGRVARTRARRT